jgi:hypothetical protein
MTMQPPMRSEPTSVAKSADAVSGHGAGYPPSADPSPGAQFPDSAAHASGRQYSQEPADTRQTRRRAAGTCLLSAQRKARLPCGCLSARDQRRELLHG